MAYPQGISFRRTLTYIDPDPEATNYDPELSTDGDVETYPRTSAQGNTVGWETDSNNYGGRDRSTSVDTRLAGVNFNSISACDYRLDLPSSGSYNIGLAAGDATYTQNVAWDIYDTSSSLGSLSTGSTSGGGQFKDATNTEYSAAAWPGSQTLATKAFSTTICRFRMASTNQAIASLYVESAGGAPRRWIFGSNLLP